MHNLVIMNNQQAVTTSLMIAEVFKREHGKVIRAIEGHIKDLKESGKPKVAHEMFAETSYINRGKEYKQYLMNRDGFSLLAMSFNNTKGVLEWKLKYIQAFNEMENQLKLKAPTNFIEALTLALEQAKTIEMQNQVIGELKPKADYLDKILKSKTLMTVTQIAKDYGMSAYEFNKLLSDLGVQYKQSGQWLLYAKHHAKGYTSSETFVIEGNKTVMNTKWAQKGRLFLYELLKKNGIMPTIEK